MEAPLWQSGGYDFDGSQSIVERDFSVDYPPSLPIVKNGHELTQQLQDGHGRSKTHGWVSAGTGDEISAYPPRTSSSATAEGSAVDLFMIGADSYWPRDHAGSGSVLGCSSTDELSRWTVEKLREMSKVNAILSPKSPFFLILRRE